MGPGRREERELKETLTAVVVIVLLSLFALLVFAVLFLPQRAETTLLLGLVAAIMGAMLPLLGVNIPGRPKDGD